MKVNLHHLEISVIRSALNLLWMDWVEREVPKNIKKDLNKYHTFCELHEKNKMCNLYWIQSIRKKLNRTQDAWLKKDKKC